MSVPAQPSFTTSATTSPGTVARGGTETLSITVRSATSLNALIDLEVYDAAGNKRFQQFWDAQSFTAGQTRNFTATWTIPMTLASGSYTVKIGIFSPGWGALYRWDNAAGSFTVT
jgi:hypothetical protein